MAAHKHRAPHRPDPCAQKPTENKQKNLLSTPSTLGHAPDPTTPLDRPRLSLLRSLSLACLGPGAESSPCPDGWGPPPETGAQALPVPTPSG